MGEEGGVVIRGRGRVGRLGGRSVAFVLQSHCTEGICCLPQYGSLHKQGATCTSCIRTRTMRS